MMRARVLGSVLVFCAASVFTDQTKVQNREITEANSVLAVYHEDWGLRPGVHGPAIILAAWPDGHIVWSKDRPEGGAPYRAAQIDAKRIADLLNGLNTTALLRTKNSIRNISALIQTSSRSTSVRRTTGEDES